MESAILTDRQSRLILIAVSVFFLGYALASRVQRLSGYLFSDEAVYLMMSQSLAHDADIRYSREDIERVYADYYEGPQGLYLKKGSNSRLVLTAEPPFVRVESRPSEALYYGKSYIQPLLAAPFVLLFNDNGFAIFHALLLALMLFSGYAYLRRFNGPEVSLLFAATFCLAGVGIVYIFWMTADFFNVASVFLACFLWLYKHAPKTRANLLDRAWTDYAAAVVLGFATFSKPTNILLILPLIIHAWSRKRILHGFAVGAVFGVVITILFAANFWATGDFNYQGGVSRKIFYHNYPYMPLDATFETTGVEMTTNEWSFPFSWKVFLSNLVYYFFGRFAGVFVYFPATVLAVIYFVRGRKDLLRWLILGVIAVEILLFIWMFPNDYQGGGAGCLGNRYFLSILPLFFFLVTGISSLRPIFWGWIFTGIFLSQILLNPYRSSFDPGLHASKYPFKWLPVELSLLNKLPCNMSPRAGQVPFGGSPPAFKLYFLDENFYPKETRVYEGYWTFGDHTSEVILQSPRKLQRITLRIAAGPRPTDVSARYGIFRRRSVRIESGEARLTFDVGGYPYPGPSYLYKFAIGADRSFIPAFDVPGSTDARDLGCFVGFEIE